MIIVTKKESIASLALLVLAGIFLYLGFTQEKSPLSQVTQSASVKTQETPGTAGIATPGAAATGKVAEQPAAQERGTTASPALPGQMPNPLEGPNAKELKEKTGSEFFVEYRLERDRIRSQEIQMLKQVIDDANTSAEVRTEAQQRLIRITEYLEQEMQLEALLQAKGYAEAAVFMQPAGVNVIVRTQELKEEDLSRIAELVARTSGRKMDEVVIIPWP